MRSPADCSAYLLFGEAGKATLLMVAPSYWMGKELRDEHLCVFFARVQGKSVCAA
jgi:hypothetical protein